MTGLALLLALSPAVSAQQPTRPDTMHRPPAANPARPDTGRVVAPAVAPARADTGRAAAPPATPADTPVVGQDTSKAAARDTTPPPQLPELPNPVPAAFSTGVWVFGRADIERFSAALTLGDLLDMIPGIARWRTGYHIQPEAASAFAQTAGRVEVFLDGFELAPVSQGSPDLSRIELAEVDSIRVERRLDVLHIEIKSLSPSTPLPYAFVHAGVGQPNARLFSGVFLAPRFLFGPVSFGVERLDSDGFKRAEGGNEFAAWGKWGRIWRNKGGVQAEFRTNTVQRNVGTLPAPPPWPGSFGSGTWALRGRWQFFPGLVADAYFGSTSVNDRRLGVAAATSQFAGMAVPIPGDTSGVAPLDTAGLNQAQKDTAIAVHQAALAKALTDTVYKATDRQLGLRLGFLRGPLWANGALRTHTALNLPGTEGDATGGLLVPRIGDVQVGLHAESWTSKSAVESRLRGRLGPFRGLSAFAEVTSGERGAPQFQRLAGDTAFHDIFTKRSAWRVGADLEWSWLSAGIARVSVTSDSVPGFGLPFDPTPGRYYLTGSMQGWESHARLQVPFFKPLSVEYWYLAWTTFRLPLSASADSITQPVYTPDQTWRASLVYHQSPLKSGHLEIYARLDAHAHGLVFDAVQPTAPVYGLCRAWSPDVPSSCQAAALTALDLFLQIRILDMRIFFQEQNILQPTSDLVTDFPSAYGRGVSSPRILYGVRWQFFN